MRSGQFNPHLLTASCLSVPVLANGGGRGESDILPEVKKLIV